MEKEIKLFPLQGITVKGMKQCIEDTLTAEGLFSPDLLYRFYTAKRIPIVQRTGNDRHEEGYNPRILKEQLEPGYDLQHTIWADTFDKLEFQMNRGRNLLFLSALSVYDKNKTKGSSIYHTIQTEDPRDALVAVFKRSNSPFLHIAGKVHLTFTQGPVALGDSIAHDYANAISYFQG